MPEGRHGIQDFADIDFATTPAQENHQPFADDPFCGNDNNRRAAERAVKADDEAQVVAAPETAIVTNAVLVPKPSGRRIGAAAPTWKPNA